MELDWVTLIEQALFIVITITVGLLGEYLRKQGVKEKIQNIKISEELKEQIAYTAVLFAQQWFENYGGEEKFNQASKFLSTRLMEYGINISDADLRTLIESALKKAKKEFQDQW